MSITAPATDHVDDPATDLLRTALAKGAEVLATFPEHSGTALRLRRVLLQAGHTNARFRAEIRTVLGVLDATGTHPHITVWLRLALEQARPALACPDCTAPLRLTLDGDDQPIARCAGACGTWTADGAPAEDRVW